MMAAWADWVMHVLDVAGLWGLAFAMFLDGACVPVPSELILPFGGFLAASGRVGLPAAVLAANAGLVAGSAVAYGFGRFGGRGAVLRFGPWLGTGPAQLAVLEAWFDRRGDWAVLLARFLPGLRTLVSVPAGLAGMPFGRFLAVTFLGSLPWSFALTYAGYLFGRRWADLRPYLGWLDWVALGLLLAVAGRWLWRWWQGRR